MCNLPLTKHEIVIYIMLPIKINPKHRIYLPLFKKKYFHLVVC